jgi:hypothetical protein
MNPMILGLTLGRCVYSLIVKFFIIYRVNYLGFGHRKLYSKKPTMTALRVLPQEYTRVLFCVILSSRHSLSRSHVGIINVFS